MALIFRPNGTLNIAAAPGKITEIDMQRCKNLRLPRKGIIDTRKGHTKVHDNTAGASVNNIITQDDTTYIFTEDDNGISGEIDDSGIYVGEGITVPPVYWRTVWSNALDRETTVLPVNTYRTYFPGSVMESVSDVRKIRLSFTATEAWPLYSCYVGHQGGENVWSFDGSQVRVTFSGSNSTTVPINSTLLSDEIELNIDTGRPLVVSMFFGHVSMRWGYPITDVDIYYINDSIDHSDETSPAGCTLYSTDRSYGLSKIEVIV